MLEHACPDKPVQVLGCVLGRTTKDAQTELEVVPHPVAGQVRRRDEQITPIHNEDLCMQLCDVVAPHQQDHQPRQKA
jgi:hypothetical protein